MRLHGPFFASKITEDDRDAAIVAGREEESQIADLKKMLHPTLVEAELCQERTLRACSCNEKASRAGHCGYMEGKINEIPSGKTNRRTKKNKSYG